MEHILLAEAFEEFLQDLATNQIETTEYLDTWDYEDEYSHNDIERARDLFIKKANDYFQEQNLPYKMYEHCENAKVKHL